MPGSKKPRKAPKRTGPLLKSHRLPKRKARSAASNAAGRADRSLLVVIEPATSFHFWVEDGANHWRTFRMERGALETRLGGKPQPVGSFRAGAYPKNGGTWAGFYVSPDPLDMQAHSHGVVEGVQPGDVIVAESWGSYDGLRVKLRVYEDAGGTISLLFEDEITDDQPRQYPLP
jgi:hypothetical protein